MNNIELIFTFIFVVLISLTIHELGHFVFAKIFGVTVYEFSIGIGPKLFYINHNGTVYCLRLIPIMAYISMSSNHLNKLYKEILNDIKAKNKLDGDLLKLSNYDHFKNIFKNKFSLKELRSFNIYKEYRKYNNLYNLSFNSISINSVSFFKNILIIFGGILFNLILFGSSILILIYGLNEQIDVSKEIQFFFINLWKTIIFQRIEGSINITNNFTSIFFFQLFLINLSLFLLNILPFPPLDGFKLVSSILEKTTNKNIPEKFDLFFSIIGIIFIVYLSIASVVGLLI
ncbi:MAG: site-2 protease family protein [Mycoplasmoidaceae bacterium]